MGQAVHLLQVFAVVVMLVAHHRDGLGDHRVAAAAHHGEQDVLLLRHVVAEFDIRPDLWFFACHFPGDPVMPGCLGLDALWQLTGFNLGWRGMEGRGRALGVGEVKFTGMVTPAVSLVRYEIDFTRVIDRKLKMAIADGRMYADGVEIYVAENLKVGLFKD